MKSFGVFFASTQSKFRINKSFLFSAYFLLFVRDPFLASSSFSQPSRAHCFFCLSSTVRCLPKDPCRHFSFTSDCFTLQRNLPSNLCGLLSALSAPGQPDRLKHFLRASCHRWFCRKRWATLLFCLSNEWVCLSRATLHESLLAVLKWIDGLCVGADL